jgi:TRAP transporter TAXI family solute receptor
MGYSNFIAVGDGKADIGLTTTDMFDDAYAGLEPYPRAYDDVVMLMRQDSTFTFIIVPADSDIYTLEDLKGKKIATPNPGTSSNVTIEKLFSVAGLTGKVNQVPGTISESMEQLRDRLVEGVCTAVGSGNATLTEVATSIDLRFIPIEGNTLNEFVALSAGFNAGVIPAGTYPGITEDVSTMVYDSALIANKNMSDDTAYWVIKTLVENWDDQVSSCSWLAEVTVEHMSNAGNLTIHPGAQKYYKEVLGGQ